MSNAHHPRDDAAQRPGRPQLGQHAAVADAVEDRLQPGDHQPSDDPFDASRAMALRQSLAATRQHQRNAEDATGWQDATGAVARPDHRPRAPRPRADRARRAPTPPTRPTAPRSPPSSTRSSKSVKQNANATYRGSYLFSGTKTDTLPYQQGAVDTYAGDEAGLDPSVPGVLREIGPGVSLSINTVGREFLGDGSGAADGKLLDTLRSAAVDLRADDAATLRDTSLGRLDANLDTVLEVARPQRRPLQPPRVGHLSPVGGRGVHGQAALADRGRRHRQGDDRLQLPAGRVPVGAARRSEHRADVAPGLPPLIHPVRPVPSRENQEPSQCPP